MVEKREAGGLGRLPPSHPHATASSFCASVSPAVLLSSQQGSWAGYLQKVLKTWREHPRPLTSLIPAILKATGPRSPPPHNALQNGTRFGKPQMTPTKPESSPCSCASLGWLGGPTLHRLQALPRNKRGAGGSSAVGPPSGTAESWAWDDGSSTRARPGGLQAARPTGGREEDAGVQVARVQTCVYMGAEGASESTHPRPQRASCSRGAAEERNISFLQDRYQQGKGRRDKLN